MVAGRGLLLACVSCRGPSTAFCGSGGGNGRRWLLWAFVGLRGPALAVRGPAWPSCAAAAGGGHGRRGGGLYHISIVKE